MEKIDVSSLSYPDWLKFVFDHPVEIVPWHFSTEYSVSDSRRIVICLTLLFQDASSLIDKYSAPQIDQGFWFITGPNGLFWAILDGCVSWDERQACINAIPTLFAELFRNNKIGTSAYMWWDSVVTYCTYLDEDVISNRQVLKAIVRVLSRLSEQPSEIEKSSARHGVEHLVSIARKENDQELLDFLAQHKLVQ